jgi:hypothetical protein
VMRPFPSNVSTGPPRKANEDTKPHKNALSPTVAEHVAPVNRESARKFNQIKHLGMVFRTVSSSKTRSK